MTLLSFVGLVGGIIFGGCCLNVFTLEKLLNQSANTTNLITFCQFLFILAIGLWLNLRWQDGFPRLPKPAVPIRRWLVHVCFFFVTSTLNNYVLTMAISMPVHVILRSLGTVFTMIIGLLFLGRKYSFHQILSGVFLTVGLVLTTIGNSGGSLLFPVSSFKSVTVSLWDPIAWIQTGVWYVKANVHPGIAILILASVLISINGFLLENTFKSAPKNTELWKESMFYQHALSIPIFLVVLHSSLAREYAQVRDQNSYSWFVYLFFNLVTQYVCVRGVNRFSGLASPLTVSVVLLLRKFTSLLLSITFFGNTLNGLCWAGISCVFLGALLYTRGSQVRNRTVEVKNNKKKK